MRRWVAILLLLCAAFFWGAGNVANKTVLDHMGPLAALGLRATVGALVIAPFAWREGRTAAQSDWARGAFGLSVLFVIAMTFQQVAFVSTSVTNVSFLVNTCSVMTPIVAWIFLRERPALRIMVAALMTLGGVFLMSGGKLAVAHLNWGDLACIASALFYAGWMVALGQHAARCRRPFATSFLQFGVAAVVMLPASLGVEAQTFVGVTGAWREILFLGVFSTGVAFALQTHAQQFVTSSAAAVLVSAESLFGALGAFLLLGERTPALGVAGGLLILLGIALAATGRRGLTAYLPDLVLQSSVSQSRSCSAPVEFRTVRSPIRPGRESHLTS